MRRLDLGLGLATLTAKLARTSLATRVRRLTLDQRLAMLPDRIEGLDGDLTIRWNEHHVPFVEAASDADLAAGFGLVHAHLRLAQMEIMRRAATGRLAEVFGRVALDVDTLLRLIDFPRATDASLAIMPPTTRAWIDGYARGVNAVCARRDMLPPELRILDIEPEPWTAEDLFAVSRLASADYSWKVWRSLIKLRGESDWPSIWADLIGAVAVADEDVPVELETLDEAMPTMFSKDGSNAAAISGQRSASGAPLIACDPHLMIAIPCIWLIVGLRSPTYHLAGLTIAGLPIVGVGRNPDSGWGGTNLHATSSELVDVTEEEALTERAATVTVRWSRPVTLRMRESRFGPVISDAAPFHSGRAEAVALKWIGHDPSDEFTPFLDMMRAKRWEDFVDALGRYSLPGLTMLHAGRDGRIGQMIAAKIPRRPLGTPADIVMPPEVVEREWAHLIDGSELPTVVDPDDGILASANNAPNQPTVTISHFFSTDHRVDRWRELLHTLSAGTIADLAAFQLDVFYRPAAEMRDRLLALFADVPDEPPAGRPSWIALAGWDGRYAEESPGALAFELIANALIKELQRRSPRSQISVHWSPFFRLTRLVDAAPEAELRTAVADAVDRAEKPFAAYKVWGRMHQMKLAHPIGRLPWLRGAAQVARFPVGGSNETVMKTMHPYTDWKHATHFGQNARFVADLADIDANEFVLLGGQDGWLGSRTIGDQVPLWRAGRLIRVPLSPEAVARAFPRVTTIAVGPGRTPAPAPAAAPAEAGDAA